MAAIRYRISLKGVVQGVGFRPFVKRLADRFALAGTVSNTAGGVWIEVEVPDRGAVERFVEAIRRERPAAAAIVSCAVEEQAGLRGYRGFTITSSVPDAGEFTLISPDLATCAECVRETLNPSDRRWRYPFTNCTNCGPRYSITRTVPYDRPNTTMAHFTLCEACGKEYRDPGDRRFHAEPNACPVCGPRVWLETDRLNACSTNAEALAGAREALSAGRIVGLKSLGGFQLACDALNAAAVDALRERKRRSRKPFAVMMRDLAAVEEYCHVSPEERLLLKSPAAPIVLLRLRTAAPAAPGLREVGVMLPYTPLHHLLFQGAPECLVMTSGNISEEPIVTSNESARDVLGPMADTLLLHDRDIFMRVDDSVVRHWGGRPRVLRRARGYAPSPIDLGYDAGGVLATGAELKNTFCITRGNYAILSQHIGDMENLETLEFFEETLRNLKSVYRAEPRLIAHDLHPDYMTTRWAARQGLPTVAVQHHHAHIASCMAENGLRERVIGIAFDGTGYGTDGQIWGGEFLVCDFHAFERAAHLRYVPLIGGDQAAHEPCRMAGAFLRDAFGADYRKFELPIRDAAPAAFWKNFDKLYEKTRVMTSSCGRLFDAASAIAGVCQHASYEGEAAILLEHRHEPAAPSCAEILVEGDRFPWTIDTRPLIREIATKCTSGAGAGTISNILHDWIVRMIVTVSVRLRAATGIETICLSGGTFQNRTLLESLAPALGAAGFQLFLHARVPPNDGGISLGQAAIAAAQLAVRG